LAETLELLDHPELNIPHKQHSRKVFVSLKALIEIIPEIEERSNVIISSLKSDDLFEEE
jgi:7,8-dihydro-6-hydroxymethylpterin-pyrophosphokinase